MSTVTGTNKIMIVGSPDNLSKSSLLAKLLVDAGWFKIDSDGCDIIMIEPLHSPTGRTIKEGGASVECKCLPDCPICQCLEESKAKLGLKLEISGSVGVTFEDSDKIQKLIAKLRGDVDRPEMKADWKRERDYPTLRQGLRNPKIKSRRK